MAEPYRPIACAPHSELEVAVLRREPIEALCAEPDATPRAVSGRAVDLRARDGAEFLTVETEGGGLVSLRLDHLRRVTRIRDGVRLVGA